LPRRCDARQATVPHCSLVSPPPWCPVGCAATETKQHHHGKEQRRRRSEDEQRCRGRPNSTQHYSLGQPPAPRYPPEPRLAAPCRPSEPVPPASCCPPEPGSIVHADASALARVVPREASAASPEQGLSHHHATTSRRPATVPLELEQAPHRPADRSRE
jgi:hypothetical protein